MFIDASVKYLQGSIEMVGSTGLSHFVRIPSSECASFDVFIRKSCEERCKHCLDRDLFSPTFFIDSMQLVPASLSLSQGYINYFSLLFNTTANHEFTTSRPKLFYRRRRWGPGRRKTARRRRMYNSSRVKWSLLTETLLQ